jgi:hypothetical protein
VPKPTPWPLPDHNVVTISRDNAGSHFCRCNCGWDTLQSSYPDAANEWAEHVLEEFVADPHVYIRKPKWDTFTVESGVVTDAREVLKKDGQ